MAVSLPTYPQFDIHQDSPPGPRWKKWKKRLENLFGALKITDAPQKKAMMLHYGGETFNDLVDTLTIPAATAAIDEYKQLVDTLDGYFEPKKNLEYEIYMFRETSQNPNETIDQFHVRLRHLSETCEFANVDREIQSQIVLKCRSTKLRRQALRETLTLKQLLDLGRTLELSEARAQVLENKTETVNQIAHKQFQHRSPKSKKGSSKKTQSNGYQSNQQTLPNKDDKKQDGKNGHKSKKCCYCGGNYPHSGGPSRNNCPASGKTCQNCHKRGHFAKACKFKQTESKINNTFVRDLSSSDEELAFQVEIIGCVEKNRSLPYTNVDINGHNIDAIIDSGATINVIDLDTYNRIGKPQLTKSKAIIKAYGTEDMKIPVLGTMETRITSKSSSTVAKVYVINRQNSGSLLNYSTANQLGLIHIVNQTSTQHNQKILGKLKDYQAAISINPDITPVAQPPRRIPFSLREKVEKQIQQLLDMDVIEEVSGPTPWVSPLVVVPKKNKEVRICVDMRQANRAVIRERYPMPTFDEILQDMNGSTWFSKIDLRMGYHQIELDENSRSITTFACHLGLFRYKRLMFGISCAPEMYQHIIRMTLQGCPGVQNISDDIIVYAPSKQEHDERLKQVLHRLESRGLTVNESKCQYHMRELNFLGHNLSHLGVKPDTSKVEAISKARAPEVVGEVRSFLGLVNYCARYIPNMATIAEPLRRLTKKNTTFAWKSEQQKAFQKLKECLTEQPVLSYYDRDAQTQVIVDASPVGLGAVLVQKQKNGAFQPVAYASKALNDVERRYSQTEKEALAVVWGCEKFHLYLLGKHFTLITDHRALEVIYGPRSKPSARVERWVLRLQPYTFEVIYKPGRTNVADILSRLTSPDTEKGDKFSTVAEEYVYFIATSATPIAMTPKDIEQASADDREMTSLRKAIRTGVWTDVPKEYSKVKDELCVKGKLILRGQRIVVPKSLQKQIITLSHEGHQGIVKSKQRLRTKVWWPKMDQQIEAVVKSCVPCQTTGTGLPAEEIHTTPLPSGPWKEVAIDIAGDFPTGEYIIVLIDYYSRWPEVLITKTITSKTIIKWLKCVFATHGLPDKITTDNGPQFVSAEFEEYLSSLNIHHHRVTPYWPQANGLVERMNRTLLKTARCAEADGKDWRDALMDILIAYRTTPQSTTGVTPSKAMFGREIKTKLPQLDSDQSHENFIERDETQKAKIKQYADITRGTRGTILNPGDKVLLKQKKKNKLTAKFSSVPYTVKKKVGNTVTIEHEGRQMKRNVTQLKKLCGNCNIDRYKVLEDDDDSVSIPLGYDPLINVPNAQPHNDHDDHNVPPEVNQPGPLINLPNVEPNNGPNTTRSGRMVKPPTRMDL